MSNPLGKVITSSGGRRLAIGDIHGCLKTFQALVDQINLTKEDQLFLLGDYVNKGPKGPEVIDFITSLSSEFSIFPLLGNHDQIVLNYLQEPTPAAKERMVELKSTAFTKLSPPDQKKYIDFLSGLHHYFILDTILLVHAGFDFTLANPFLGTEAMLLIREFYYDSSKAQGKSVIHGHFPYPLEYIKTQIEDHNKIIPLDNGCVYEDSKGQGNLLCLDLDTDQLWVQPKLD